MKPYVAGLCLVTTSILSAVNKAYSCKWTRRHVSFNKITSLLTEYCRRYSRRTRPINSPGPCPEWFPLTHALHPDVAINGIFVDKVKFTVGQAMKAQRGSRGTVLSLLFFNLGTRWGWVVNATPRPLYPRERDPVPIVQDAGWAPGPVWKGAKNLVPIGIRSPDRPACRYTGYTIPAHSISIHRVEIPSWSGYKASQTQMLE
jgi:hypothetical protein